MIVMSNNPLNQKNPLVHSDMRDKEEGKEKDREKKQIFFQ